MTEPRTKAGRALIDAHKHYDVCNDPDCWTRADEFRADILAIEDEAAQAVEDIIAREQSAVGSPHAEEWRLPAEAAQGGASIYANAPKRVLQCTTHHACDCHQWMAAQWIEARSPESDR